MLTRLEAHGFKNLLDFGVDLGPFNCLAGANGVGKSNVIDAVRFLSLLTDHTLVDAALSVRGAKGGGDPEELFWTDGRYRTRELRLAAEMLIEPQVSDGCGRVARASSTYLRYEVAIGREPLALRSEQLGYVTERQADRRLRFPHSAADFRRPAVVNRRRLAEYISTRQAGRRGNGDGYAEIVVHQDAAAGGPLRARASTAPRTVLGATDTAATPTILAARREMAQWRRLALSPAAMSRPDRFHSPRRVGPDGAHLAATLYRLVGDARRAGGNLARRQRITARLAELLPVEAVRVAVDEERKLLTLEVTEKGGSTFPARALSGGALRFLALAILGEDPDLRGLLCVEEPENGLHPGGIDAVVKLLRELAVDPHRASGPDNPLRQVLIATHSPAFVQRVDDADLLLATTAQVQGPAGRPAPALRCRPIAGTWRTRRREQGISPGAALAHLTAPHGAQLPLPPFL